MTELPFPVNISTLTNRSVIRADADSPENIPLVSRLCIFTARFLPVFAGVLVTEVSAGLPDALGDRTM